MSPDSKAYTGPFRLWALTQAATKSGLLLIGCCSYIGLAFAIGQMERVMGVLAKGEIQLHRSHGALAMLALPWVVLWLRYLPDIVVESRGVVTVSAFALPLWYVTPVLWGAWSLMVSTAYLVTTSSMGIIGWIPLGLMQLFLLLGDTFVIVGADRLTVSWPFRRQSYAWENVLSVAASGAHGTRPRWDVTVRGRTRPIRLTGFWCESQLVEEIRQRMGG